MSLSPELSPPSETHSYPPYSPHCHLQHPDQADWLTSASPIAKATSFSRPYAPAKASASSSDSGSSTMKSFRPHQSDIGENLFSDIGLPGQPIGNSLAHLHLSALEHTTTWGSTSPYQMPCSIYDNPGMLPQPTGFGGAYSSVITPASRYSTPSMYEESPLQSPYFSSPDIAYAGFAGQRPRSLPIDDCDYYDEEQDPLGGKPYARLIFDALFQAPGHRMMLRDIYDWFETNTSKPRESGTNGWQNSIRHNLSMNHAFENDKTQCTNARGEPKKATSVWFLTENALRNGVQSTTRYRKHGGVRRSALNGKPDALRAKSGAKGGRAARRAARLRQMEQSPHMSWVSPVTPDDLSPFNHLVHAANAMNDFPPTRSNSPPSPPEHYPYTPRSPGPREGYATHDRHNTKYEGGEGTFNGYNPQNHLFPQPSDTDFDDAWFHACQQY